MSSDKRATTKSRVVSRRPRHKRSAPQRWWRRKRSWALLACGAFVAVVGLAVLARAVAPKSNTDAYRMDAIIVLGYPADSDGNPTPEQLARVNESVREYERGVAPYLIMTGGSAHNQFVEAEVMARTAAAQGIPASHIVVERQAQDTIQNACYAVRLMKERGWRSAEVISSASHLPRAGLIFDKTGIEWRTHAAPSLEPHAGLYNATVAAVETVKTLRYLVFTQWTEKCTP
ncbi:MAG TPA: YdcF family protein [Terracidiphilus sp.]